MVHVYSEKFWCSNILIYLNLVFLKVYSFKSLSLKIFNFMRTLQNYLPSFYLESRIFLDINSSKDADIRIYFQCVKLFYGSGRSKKSNLIQGMVVKVKFCRLRCDPLVIIILNISVFN